MRSSGLKAEVKAKDETPTDFGVETDANIKGAVLIHAKMNDVILCNTIMPDGSVTYS